MRRLTVFAAAAWVGRWAAIELAAYAGRHWVRPRQPSLDEQRPPGWMPRRSD